MGGGVVIALIGMAGSVIGSIIGVLAAARLTNYRLEQLEKKVDKHNNVIERVYQAEGDIQELQHETRDIKAVLERR